MTSPISVDQLRSELRFHPDRSFADSLCEGLINGFDTLIATQPSTIVECKNLRSAMDQPAVVDALLTAECQKGFLLGPFSQPPFDLYRVSPIGIATGKYSNKHRLIVDLSAPHNHPTNSSINDTIDKNQCSLTYVKIDDAIRLIKNCGKGALLCKTDISDAFKLLPIRRDQWPLFGIKWKSQYYFYHRLAFGCRSSPAIFDKLSTAICWIAQNNYGIENILHLLDDFLTVDSPVSDCVGERTMALLTTIFHRLHIPLSDKKTVGPVTVLEYLGIILDSIRMEARLPQNKIERILDFLTLFVGRQHCTKRELLQLLGHLNFASRVILPGRSFVSHLIQLSTTVKELHHHIHLNQQCQSDIRMWKDFLLHWNGISLFYDNHLTSAADMELFTDASSTIGFGGYFGNRWFASSWPNAIVQQLEATHVISMAFMELYPIVVAAILWGESWSTKKVLFNCDNLGTVQIIQKGRSKSPLIMKLMRRLTLCSIKNNFCVYAAHVPGKNNCLADFLSRLQIQDFLDALPMADSEPHQCPPPSEVMLF